MQVIVQGRGAALELVRDLVAVAIKLVRCSHARFDVGEQSANVEQLPHGHLVELHILLLVQVGPVLHDKPEAPLDADAQLIHQDAEDRLQTRPRPLVPTKDVHAEAVGRVSVDVEVLVLSLAKFSHPVVETRLLQHVTIATAPEAEPVNLDHQPIWPNDALELDAVRCLVPVVDEALSSNRPSYGAEGAVDEANTGWRWSSLCRDSICDAWSGGRGSELG